MEPEYRERMDRWLDGALKQYGEAEPRVGLEGRVLANLHTAAETSVHGWRWWPVMAAVVLIMGTVAFVAQLHRDSPRTATSIKAAPATREQGVPSASGVSKAVAPVVASSTRRQTSGIRLAKAVPRLDQFPSAQPLSAQDKPLLQYLQNAARTGVLQTAVNPESLVEPKPKDPSASVAAPVALPTLDLNLKQVATLTPDALPSVPFLQN